MITDERLSETKPDEETRQLKKKLKKESDDIKFSFQYFSNKYLFKFIWVTSLMAVMCLVVKRTSGMLYNSHIYIMSCSYLTLFEYKF